MVTEDGVIAELLESGFEDWSKSTEWLARSENELDRLQWRPMGDGFWLRLTTHGEQVASKNAPS